jgi:hypothetical protein
VLGHEREADQQQQEEWNGGEQRIEGDGARQEGQMAFVSGLEDAADESAG